MAPTLRQHKASHGTLAVTSGSECFWRVFGGTVTVDFFSLAFVDLLGDSSQLLVGGVFEGCVVSAGLKTKMLG